MKKVSIADAKDKLTELLRKVEQGERVLITRRGAPVAELGPPTAPVANSFSLAAIKQRQQARGLADAPAPVPDDFNEIDAFPEGWPAK
ncbi:MAG: type II toxin-antitoxin system Phd/YefM family antitoxin [Caulobacterales bacterium]|jgi:prevent-host-death family protein